MTDVATLHDSRLDEITRLIVEAVHPELVLLYGSRARGDARPDSDYDILIVVRDGVDVERARKAGYAALEGRLLSADILARTVNEYGRRQHDPGFLDWLIARDGRVLFTTGTVAQRSPAPDRVREGTERGEGVRLWLRKAEHDRYAAETMLASANPPWDVICLHSHQMTEKLLKALIVTQGKFPPHKHTLTELLERELVELRNDATVRRACAVLDAVYPKTRYPGHGDPTPVEGREAIAGARAAREILLAKLGF